MVEEKKTQSMFISQHFIEIFQINRTFQNNLSDSL